MRGAGLLLHRAVPWPRWRPGRARALEARYDHRDQAGVVLEPLLAHDSIAISGRAAKSFWRPALRLAYTWDPLGDGNELVRRARSCRSAPGTTPAATRCCRPSTLAIAPSSGPTSSRRSSTSGSGRRWPRGFAIGPMVGLGVAYDFSRSSGVYVQGAFSTAFGQARIASLSFSAGGQLRF